jgi:hypothetical protein
VTGRGAAATAFLHALGGCGKVMGKLARAAQACDTGDIREGPMVERKAAMKRAPARPELERLLERARSVTLTDEQIKEQRASFVYGNAPLGSRITKESARRSVDRVRVLAPK